MKIIAIIVVFLLTVSCSETSRTVAPDRTAEKGESYNDLAWKMHDSGEPPEKFLGTQQKAVEQMRKGESHDDPVAVLDQMGFFYNVVGNYEEALKYYMEAGDSLESIPVSSRGEGAVMHFGDLSSLYGLLGMDAEAIQYSDSAIAESKRQNGIMLSDVYRFRAGIFQLQGNFREATKCYDQASEAVRNGNTRADKNMLLSLIAGEKAYSTLELYPENMDSVNHVIGILEKAVNSNIEHNSVSRFTLGHAYALRGDIDKGVRMMIAANREFQKEGDIEMYNYANQTLMDTYVKNGMCGEILSLYPEYVQIQDSMMNNRKANALIAAMIQYDVKAKEDKNTILRLQLKASREKSIIVMIAISLVVLFLGGATIILLMRNRMLNYRRELQKRQLNDLRESNEKLSERVDTLEHDLSVGMHSNNRILSSPQLITGKDEGVFRRAFNVLYPDFIADLKSEYPTLSANDELLCMLLYLKHTSEEISVYLGISRASVNSARYRLRTKFKLPKSVDLDDFITSRAPHA